MEHRKLVGVTVFPEYIQSEGIDAVLDRLVDVAGANAVTTSPYVMAKAAEGGGEREPPDDAGQGMTRLLDRPLWGARELRVETAPSFEPSLELYAGLRYQPPPATDLTQREGGKIGAFVRAAKARGLRVYLQIQAAYPPGYRAQFGEPAEADAPRLPNGRLCPQRVDRNGSLASPEIRGYGEALVRDVVAHYPEIDGLRVDWPEYPPYTFESLFFDFSDHAMLAAKRWQFDTKLMRQDAKRLYDFLHGQLDSERLAQPGSLAESLDEYPGVRELLRFKAALVRELLSGFRKAINTVAGKSVELVPNAFPPPWNIATGMDYSQLTDIVEAVSVKLYTMHWPMIVGAYTRHLRESNPGVSDSELAAVVVRALQLDDPDNDHSLAESTTYPAPDVPHPVGRKAQRAKIRSAQASAGRLPVYALAHSYGPPDDFAQRFAVAHAASPHGVWVNRYGYLSDNKLSLMGDIVNEGRTSR